MPFGVNLSFAVKRWVTPELWAPLVRCRLGVDLVQFSFDLVDPMWPDALLSAQAGRIRTATAAEGIAVHSAFIGLAHYTYNQLLHPDPDVRDYAEQWLMRAYRFAAASGAPRVGGPLGAIAARGDADEAEAIPERDYADLVTRLHRLSAAAKAAGILELYIEPTPLRREWPWTIPQAERLLADLGDAPVPWRWCIDWGHATFAPLYGREAARMETWLNRLRGSTGVLHLQQTDGLLDRHWDFTQDGIVDPAAASALHRRAGLAEVPVFLEVFYPFERTDAEVLEGMTRSCAILRPHFV
jgi:sugar phosphate isomerase/epimerase